MTNVTYKQCQGLKEQLVDKLSERLSDRSDSGDVFENDMLRCMIDIAESEPFDIASELRDEIDYREQFELMIMRIMKKTIVGLGGALDNEDPI
ncbi:hypothetical protein OAA86_09545 [Rhodospirillales bacterium]|nr:hypothetical protein [Rhodospirillales bacterium]